MIKGGKRRKKRLRKWEKKHLSKEKERCIQSIHLLHQPHIKKTEKCSPVEDAYAVSWYQHDWGQMVTRHSCISFQAELNPKNKTIRVSNLLF